MTQIRLNILPLYRCNQNCQACPYACSNDKTQTMDLAWLDSALSNISREFDIAQILLSGGEVSLLSDLYLDMFYQICKMYSKKIYVETRFIRPKKAILNNFDIINVRYDFDTTNPFKQDIFADIKAAVSVGKIINLKTLDIFCQKDKVSIVSQINSLKVKSWEIIPYHQTKDSIIKFKDYSFFEKTIKDYLALSGNMKFAFQNKLQLENILPIDNYNIKTVYLTPNNMYALQEFDDQNNFSLKEFSNINDLINKMKENEISRDNFCKNCTSKLMCLANYYLNLNYQGPSCSGFKDLIRAYNTK